MARIKDVTEYVETSPTTTIVPPLPDHVAGDLILVFAVGDGVINAFTATGWTIGGQQQSAGTTTAACRAAWIYKIAASSEESVSIVSTSTTWCVTSIVIEGADATTPIDVSNGNGILINANPGTGVAFASASVTTTTNNTLVFHTMFNSLSTPSPFPGIRTVSSHDTGAIGLGIGMIPQVAIGASGTWDFYTEDHTLTTQNSVSFTIAIKDSASSTLKPAYLNRTHADMLTPFRGTTASVRGETTNTTNTNVFTNLAGIHGGQSTKVFHYKSSTTTFTDITTAANDTTTGDFTLLNAGFGAGDYIAFCADTPFGGLSGVATVSGAGGTFTWEVYNGTTWTPITVTFGSWVGTTWTAFTWPAAPVGAKFSMVIAPAILRKISSGIWAPATLNGVTGYWLRNVFSVVPTTNATFTHIIPSMGGVSYDALAAAADTGCNPFHNSASSTPSVYSATLPGLNGTYRTLGTGIAPYTPANKIIIGSWTFGSPRDYIDAGARFELSGVAVSLIDASWNDRTYFIGAYKAKDTYQNERNVYALQWNATTKTYNNCGIQVDPTSISSIGCFSRQIRGAGIQYYNQCVSYGIPILSGGTISNPILKDEFLNTFAIDYYYPLPLIRNNVAILPIQIGGDDAVCVNLDGLILSFPRITTEPNAFADDAYCSYHYDLDYLGLILDGRNGDVIKIVNSVISSPSRCRFEITSTATSGCTWDFSGTTIINHKITLKNVTTYSNLSFRSCLISDITSCTINNSVFSSCSTVAAAGATLNGDTFESTTGVNALTFASVAESNAVDNCAFTNNNRAIKITTPGTYTFDGHSFSGNVYDVENSSSGAVIINNINGSNTSTYINTGGGTTTIVNVVNLTVKCVDESGANIPGVVVYLEKASDKTQLMSTTTDALGIATTTYNYSGDTGIIMRLRKSSSGTAKYVPIRSTGTITSTGFSVTVTMYLDTIAAP